MTLWDARGESADGLPAAPGSGHPSPPGSGGPSRRFARMGCGPSGSRTPKWPYRRGCDRQCPGWHEGSIFLPTEPGGAASPDSTEADWQRAGRQGCAGRTNSRSTRTGGPGPRRRPRMCCTTSGLGPNPDMRFGRKPGVRSSGTPGLEPAELAARVRHGATGQQFAWPTLGGWSCNEIRWM